MKNKQKILVTGGVGFIGSALAKKLHEEGHQVVVLDNFNDYYDVSFKHARQEALLKDITVITGDIIDSTLVVEVLKEHQIDLVAHVAAQAGVRHSIDHPDEYVQSNVCGTQNLFEGMQCCGVKRMVYASTSSAYGTDTPTPFSESAAADRPISVYAATKRAGELLAHAYYSLYGIETTVLRFFNVYGPWVRPDMALYKFTKAMLASEPIDIYNNGEMRRDFTYIDDIVDGFVLAVDKPLGYEIINLGNGQPVELMAYVEALEAALGIEAKKNFLPMQPGDVYETYADTTKAKELLGFEPKVDIKEGVKKFVSWYQNYYK